MSRVARFAVLTLLLGGAASVLGACQTIAGIEDRKYVPEEGTLTATVQECETYCAKTSEVCGNLLYRTTEACMATCALLPAKGVGTNSVACRMNELAKFVATGEDQERARYCANAGPGGNDACGSNCQNYCYLLRNACTDTFQKYAGIADPDDDGTAFCEAKCLGLADTGLYDSTDTGNYLGDTLQCRIVHTTSSTIDPMGHCGHADLKSTKCVDDPPNCETFCHLEMAECAEFPMYESKEQCLDVCNALPQGPIPDTPAPDVDIENNTSSCRTYHSYNSIIDAKTHCKHTGPGGDGHCSTDHDPSNTGNCESYCLLLEAACADDFHEKYKDQAACEAKCAPLEGAVRDSGYSLTASGDNVQCRLLHVSRALRDATECAAAQGATPCK